PFHKLEVTAEPSTTIRSTPPGDAPTHDYRLSAILGGTRPLAMIDDRFVGIGDTLADDVTIAAIDEFTVTLRDRDRTRVLRLPE
ncbi:MAG: hypothetical protein JXO22_02660, partial [Phycisphaerae bacterium]|nr:hypothetical protein [Phycisphaerae bacterium]